MYIPTIYSMNDKQEIIEFMKRFSFATIVSIKDNIPQATHLPFNIADENGVISLISHFARANDQWKDIDKGTVLVIFNEPHAYISPKNYEKEMNVPTWNYLAVHAYGQATLITDLSDVTVVMEKTIDNYEAAYKTQWERLPTKYKEGMINGIVAFKVKVNNIQAKKKLSQNKTENEKKNIIKSLEESSDTNEKSIAAYMKVDLNAAERDLPLRS